MRLAAVFCFAWIALVAAIAGVAIAVDTIPDNGRAPTDVAEQRYWLANMRAHNFSPDEVGAAWGISTEQAGQLIESITVGDSSKTATVPQTGTGQIVILPYPGGRHPRIGFLEGAINPQRETKVSVFAPWNDGGYVVVDLPEAVWHQSPAHKRELLYLAHTHVPTLWDRLSVTLTPLEWNREKPGALSLTRNFPNEIQMTSKADVVADGVRFKFSVKNGTSEILTGLQIQMCGMLKSLTGFSDQTNDNKVFSAPFAACRDRTGNRWVILGFDHCHRAWGNARCPCLHADPLVPDCAPGETQTVRGWLSFFEGPEIAAELKRLDKVAFAAGTGQ